MLKVGDKIIIKSKSILKNGKWEGTKSDWVDFFGIDLSKTYIIHKVWNNNEYLFVYEIKINRISAFFSEKDLIKVDFLPDRLFEI